MEDKKVYSCKKWPQRKFLLAHATCTTYEEMQLNTSPGKKK